MLSNEEVDAHARSLLVSSYFYELARWERAVKAQKDRLQGAIRDYLAFERAGTHRGESDFHMDVMMDVHFLFVAVAQLYFVARRIREHSGNPGITRAVSEFEEELRDAKRMRDLFEHIGDYMENKGRLNVPWPDGARIALSETPEPELALVLEGQSVDEEVWAVETAAAAVSLADAVSIAWDGELAGPSTEPEGMS